MRLRFVVFLCVVIVAVAIVLRLLGVPWVGIFSNPEQDNSAGSHMNQNRSICSLRPPRVRETGIGVFPMESSLGESLDRIRSQGDYQAFGRLLENTDPGARYELLSGPLLGYSSPLGKEHDFKERMTLIQAFGGPKVEYLETKACKSFGVELDQGSAEFLTRLESRLWTKVVSGMAEDNPRKAFSFAASTEDLERRHFLISKASGCWLVSDSMAMSSFVNDLKQGDDKDVAITEIVTWLSRKRDYMAASQWLDQLSSDETRRKLLQSTGMASHQ